MTMTDEEIERLYPEFNEWWRKEKGYVTLNGVWLIKMWYEFLRERGRRMADSEPEPGVGLGVSPYRSNSVIEQVF